MTEAGVVLWPTGLFALGTLAIVAAAFGWLRLVVLRRHRRSRERGLLREPAHSLRRRLELVDYRMTAAAIGLPLSLFLWTLLLPHAATGAAFRNIAIFAFAGAVALAWFGRELVSFWPEREGLREAIEAQTRSALSLNLLMRQKYWVFHDVHIGDHRINHLVIGPRGVFCVDSLWRRPVRGRLDWTGRRPAPRPEVVFRGEALLFPGWRETAVLEHVETQAQWLGPWLAARVGEAIERIPTHAAVSLPGWQVTCTHWKRVIVFNPSTPNMLVQGAPEGRRIDTTTTQALIKVLQENRHEIADAGLRHRPSVFERVRAGVKHWLGRPGSQVTVTPPVSDQ